MLVRIHRVELGNFGDYKSLRGDMFELRIHSHPACRIYFGKYSSDTVILLTGGTKSKQAADIKRAKAIGLSGRGGMMTKSRKLKTFTQLEVAMFRQNPELALATLDEASKSLNSYEDVIVACMILRNVVRAYGISSKIGRGLIKARVKVEWLLFRVRLSHALFRNDKTVFKNRIVNLRASIIQGNTH